MPVTRVVERTFNSGGEVLAEQKTIVISDAKLADEAETAALAKADILIDAIGNLADAKLFLKRLCKRLIKNGVLP